MIIALAVSSVVSLVQAEDHATPPRMWETGVRDQGQVLWDQFRKDDGKVAASEVIEWMYKNQLSHHDGDSQKYAAFLLIQLDDDPLLHLRKMMIEEKPERRVYAVLIAGWLGDTRLTEDVRRLLGDKAKLGQFDGVWFWDTVADAAEEDSRSLADGGVAALLRGQSEPVAAWVPPTKSKAIHTGAGQHRPSPESHPEGRVRPQPDSEGRSR